MNSASSFSKPPVSLQGSSVGLFTRSCTLTSTPQVSSNTAVIQSRSDNYMLTGTNTQLSLPTTGRSLLFYC